MLAALGARGVEPLRRNALPPAGPLAAISIYVISGLVRFDWGKWLSLPVVASDELNEDETVEDH